MLPARVSLNGGGVWALYNDLFFGFCEVIASCTLDTCKAFRLTPKKFGMKNTTQRLRNDRRNVSSEMPATTKQPILQSDKHAADKAGLLNEKSKLVRRYSFDDNGGGYAGL